MAFRSQLIRRAFCSTPPPAPTSFRCLFDPLKAANEKNLDRRFQIMMLVSGFFGARWILKHVADELGEIAGILIKGRGIEPGKHPPMETYPFPKPIPKPIFANVESTGKEEGANGANVESTGKEGGNNGANDEEEVK